MQELAKRYEHRERNYSMALEFTSVALGIEDSEELRYRAQRVKKRVDKPRSRKLL